VPSEGEGLTMFPALNIDQKVAREGLDILDSVCDVNSCECGYLSASLILQQLANEYFQKERTKVD